MRGLDLGCGTGTLTVALARSCLAATVVGLDADRDILVQARAKAAAAGVAVEFVEGLAETPPFPRCSFDRVVSSLMFHHLTTEAKRHALAAASERLRDGGELHVADWGEPHDWLMRLAFVPVQLLDGFAVSSDNVRGDLPRLIAEAGFADVEQTHRERTALGTLALVRGVASRSGA
jgi:cyclopropane fatty-acyl-phospholipid synthase-like methyltransferase